MTEKKSLVDGERERERGRERERERKGCVLSTSHSVSLPDAQIFIVHSAVLQQLPELQDHSLYVTFIGITRFSRYIYWTDVWHKASFGMADL